MTITIQTSPSASSIEVVSEYQGVVVLEDSHGRFLLTEETEDLTPIPSPLVEPLWPSFWQSEPPSAGAGLLY